MANIRTTAGYRKWAEKQPASGQREDKKRQASGGYEAWKEKRLRKISGSGETDSPSSGKAGNEDWKSKRLQEGLGEKRYRADQKTAQAEQKQVSALGEGKGGGILLTADADMQYDPIRDMAQVYQRDTSWQQPDERWDEKSRGQFGYLYSRDPEQAKRYAADVNEQLDRAEEQERREKAGAWALEHKGLGTVAAIGAQALGGIGEYLSDTAEMLGRGQITRRGGRLSPTEYAGAITGAISKELNEKYGTVEEKDYDRFLKDEEALVVLEDPHGQNMFRLGANLGKRVMDGRGWGDVYQLGTSAAQSMMWGAAGKMVGAPAQLASMVSYFGQAAASGVDDALERGGSSEQALGYGALMGLAEMAAEQIDIRSLNSLDDAANLYELLTNMAKQGVSEGLEEGVTSLVGTFADELVMQDKSQRSLRILAYMEDGMTEEEANRQAWNDAVDDALFSMFGGFATGGVAGGIQTGINSFTRGSRTEQLYGEHVQDLVNEGLQSPESSDSRKLAEGYQQRMEQGERINGVEINRLVEANDRQIRAEMETEEAEPQDPAATDQDSLQVDGGFAEGMNAGHTDGEFAEDMNAPDTDEDVLAELSDLGLHEEEARVLRENFRDTEMDRSEYVIGVRTAFQYGKLGIPARELTRKDSAASTLAEHQRITAYKYGRLHGQQQGREEQKALAGKRVAEYKNVEYEGDWNRLNGAQTAGITAVNALGESLGIRYRFYESYEKNGQRMYLDENGVEKKAPNGFYRDGVIHLDIHAGDNGQGTVLFTAAHEMTHFIREWSPEKFRVLADTLMEGYAGADTNVEQLINEKIAAYRDTDETLSFEQAFEEVVADSMETMLSDGSFAERIQKLKQQDRTLWEKIRDWFVSMADSIRKAYESLKPDSREGKLVAQMVDTAEKLKELFAEATVDAAGNLQRAEKNTAGEAMNTGTKFSYAGRMSASADGNALERAMKMLEQGTDREEVRQKTGWFRGMDGKWRYEIDDSEMRIADQISNYMSLGDLMNHPKLYTAYPDLADVSVVFQSMSKGVNGSYDPRFDHINLAYTLKTDPVGLKDALVHELQHAVQAREGFTRGATVGMWEKRLEQGFDSRKAADIRQAQEVERELRSIQEQEPEFYRDMMELNDMTPDLPRGEIDWETLETISEDPIEWQRYDARREELEEKYGDTKVWDMNDLLYQRERAASNQGRNAMELYFETAGEIEARDASNRRTKSEDQRKTSPPRLGNEDTVFAEGTGVSADYVGKTTDGIEVYETSEKTKNLTWTERKKTFLHLMRQQYRGRTAKFIRNGHAYYAKFEYRDVSKNIYGDDKSDPKGRDAKVNVGADGNIFELVENSKYLRSETERGKTQRMHRGVKHWDYFVKTVQIDGAVFDLVANVRKKTDGEFVYVIEMMENKEIEPSSPQDSQNSGRNRVPNSSIISIGRNVTDVKDSEQNYSIRDPEYRQVQDALEQENEKLRKDVENLKELVKLQRTVTNGTKFTKTSVDAAAGLLMEKAGVTRGKRELVPILEKFYAFIAGNDGYDWPGVAAEAQEVVDWLLEHRKKDTGPDDYSREILNTVRGMRIRLNDSQAVEAAGLYGSVNEYRKRMMGSVTISKDGTPLDMAWQELASLYPGEFDADVTDGDMPVKLAEIVGRLRNNSARESEWRYEQEVLGQELVREVYDSCWDAVPKLTFADRKQKQINALRAEHSRQIHDMRKDMRALREKHTRRMEDIREGRHRTEMRHKIQKRVKKLNDLLLKGDKDHHVPESLRKAVADALDVVNMDTVGAQARIEELDKQIARAKTEEKKLELMERRLRVSRMGGRMDERLAALKAAYETIRTEDDSSVYDEGIAGKIQETVEAVGNTALRDMTMAQLESVHDLYTAVAKSISTANKAFRMARGESITQLGSSVMEEVRAVGGSHKESLKLLEDVKSFGWNNLKPEYAMRAIGSDTLSELFGNVRAGEDTWARDVQEAKTFCQEKASRYGYWKWDLEETRSFTSRNGLEFRLNLPQMMSLYAYSKREQADQHLQKGGFVFDTEAVRKEKVNGGITVEKLNRDATAYNLGHEELGAVVAALTNEQKAFVDEMQDYLSAVMGGKGNEVSMALYDIRLFKEKHYFPLKSAKQLLFQQTENTGEVRLKNSGFSRKTTPEAGNPVILTGFMDVWANHVNDMSMYHAFVLPLEDFNRVFNYHTVNTADTDSSSVKAVIQNAYGTQAERYIRQLLTNLNGGARTDPTTGFINKMMGKFKKGAVFASMSVVVQQPSAIGRAMAVIDPKYFGGEMIRPRGHKLLWEEVKNYAPVALIKEMGYFDTNMGRSTVDYITAKEYSGLKEKVKGFFVDSGYRDEVLSIAPALADEISWCYIWQSVKRETADRHKDLEPGSEEFLKLAGSRFTEVITRTQVYDSVLSRSANMRSKDTGMKMATAFLAEPTTSINMVTDALLQAKRGDKKAARRAIGSVIASQILNACLVSFVYAMRDDDEDETYGEKYMASFVGNVVDSMNPLTYLPFTKDIVSIVQGYEVERADMAVIGDLVNAWRKLGSDKLGPWEKVEQFTSAVAQMFGLPVKNILRDARAVWQTTENIGSHMKSTKSGMKNAVKEGITGSRGSRAERMYQAAIDGDTEYVKRLWGLYKDDSAARTAMTNAIQDALENEDITQKEAEDHLKRFTYRTSEESESKVLYWLYKQEYPEGELGENALAKYHSEVERSGISLEEYTEYLEKLPDFATKEEALEVIDSMRLTKRQKDALYRAAGYAESTIDEAPWH